MVLKVNYKGKMSGMNYGKGRDRGKGEEGQSKGEEGGIEARIRRQIKVGLKCYLDKRITSYRNFLP